MGVVYDKPFQEARLAAAPLTISDVRRQVIDFTEPIMEVATTILVKKPASGEPAIQSAQDLADQTAVCAGNPARNTIMTCFNRYFLLTTRPTTVVQLTVCY